MASSYTLTDHVAANLSKALQRSGWSQAELAERSGVHFVCVNRVLNRRVNPTIETVERLALALGVRPEKLFRKSS